MKKQTIAYVSAIDGQRLIGVHTQVDNPKARVVFFHGMAEHQKRYDTLVQQVAKAGYDCLTIDQRGHGESLFDRKLKGHFADESGWERNVMDAHAMIQSVQANSMIPLYIFGHSMGTLVARSYLKRYGHEVHGLYLSGSPDESPLARAGYGLAQTIALTYGKRHPSPLMTKMTFGTYNAGIKNPKTSMDWISVDEANVQAYIADPLCGFDFTAQAFVDLLKGMHEVYHPTKWKAHNPMLPIHFVSGKEDPCYQPKGLEKAVKTLNYQGYQNVSFHYVEGSRHEVFNDLRKELVTQELLDWLHTQVTLNKR